MEFYNGKRPHSAHGGQPTAVVNWRRIEKTNPDQQEQRITQIPPEAGQQMGSSSDFHLLLCGEL